VIVLDILGTPAPKGSNRAILRGGKARFVPGGSQVNQQKLKSWDVAVREAALASDCSGGLEPRFVQTPLAVEIEFRMARPAGHWAKRGGLKPSAPESPATKPDVDKLARATLDSLSGIVFDDDSRIVELVVRKVYAQPGREGAHIAVRQAGVT
jgi:Holliday junction resolvase RusA-like endonuclease